MVITELVKILKKTPTFFLSPLKWKKARKTECANVTYSALDIANFYIGYAKEKKRPVTPMKLQKLLYYAQGWFLALTGGSALFSEDFYAWDYGPVCTEVYREFNKNGANPIEKDLKSAKKIENHQIESFLQTIWDKYGRFTASQLSTMTHLESPWLNADRLALIEKTSMQQYFHSLLKDDRL